MTATLAPGRHGGGLEHRPDAGRHATADERGHARVDAIGEWHGRRDRHDRRLGHRPDPAIGQDRLAIGGRQDRGAIRHPVPERRRGRARPRHPGAARPARPARHEPRQRDGLADTQRRHARTDRLDDAGALVAHRHRTRSRPVAVAHVQVRVADARRGHPDADLAGARLGQRQRLDLDRLPWVAEDGGPDRAHRSATRRRSVDDGRFVRHVGRPPHRGVDDRLELGIRGRRDPGDARVDRLARHGDRDRPRHEPQVGDRRVQRARLASVRA